MTDRRSQQLEALIMSDLQPIDKHSSILTILNGGWRQHIMTDAHRSDTPALLTGGQEQAVKHHHLVPQVIFALVYPGKWNQLCLPEKKTHFFCLFICFVFLMIILLFQIFTHSPDSIWTSCILTEKVICSSPPSNTPTLQNCKENCMCRFNNIKRILICVKMWVFTNNIISSNL